MASKVDRRRPSPDASARKKPVFGWGGARPGAGRPKGRSTDATPHLERPPHAASAPVLVTMRALPGLPSFREDRVFASLADALRLGSTDAFRIVHFSVQRDRLLLIVEADAGEQLRAGLQGLAIRLGRTFNRITRHTGRVWGMRHDRRDLRTPREVRSALAEVLFAHRKLARGGPELDPKSSALWFDGFVTGADRARAKLQAATSLDPRDPCVARARTPLLSTLWWKEHGRIDPAESPR